MDESHISKFNKSFARSEPNLPRCRQINVTEYFESSQFFATNDSHYEYGLGSNTPQIDYHLHQFYNNDYCFEETLKKDFNDSPMDIDQSQECVDVLLKENCSYKTKLNTKPINDLNEKVEEIESVQTIEKMTKNESNKQSGMGWGNIILIFVVGVSLSLGFLIYTDVNLIDIQLNDIENDLKLNIFNQNHIIDRIVFNLNKIHTNTEFKRLLILVGSTGVGKTLILNRLKMFYPAKLIVSLNYNVNKEIIEQKSDIFFTNKCFILLIDDLKINQLEIIENFTKNLQSQCVFMILAFNVQDTNNDLTHIIRHEHFKEISQFFMQRNSISETLMLNTMNKRNLENFIIDIVKKRGMNPDKHINFIQNLVKNHDVDKHGFKGIVPKINLIE
ncbi:uncharacterized protein [Onthophagus taurus]|uniref:uncharacterized protein isoform X2 n=1 Tax=Onthophagus taurus TaxID=166361 RepID=UPI000C2043B6|nr:uncharacterized protein LOC111428768 isoform X2 [Onthophagus taurus]